MFSDDALLAEIPRLRRYARGLTGDAARADDLVQDTLERALVKGRLWRPGNLRAWLLTMMHNVFVNQYRASGAMDFRAPEDLPEVAVRPQQLDGIELRELERALQQLSPEQREVLLLVTLEDMSYEDTARILGTPIGTVMSRLSRARERLRQVLAGQSAVPDYLKVVK
ncbi:sigma-70 family RNA polymerase sigma factor [Aromatoleum petrolei]|uniref:Sigma-70 family RNA polymerase sigma factor n=1 Tax=Aromatoleum petrolei TaxID=76116 RepID=A0ABX1MQC8_9RHOO|nr:sigma-70 family RNA polymerase sigma factor [Aromatoleum petrolei]NMF90167.1 sigma-70 family RNA polymerase sigma factor [Aromatoleum petrolei]QTQ37667.1 RNA polymerase sigma-70 factor, ECF subfamily [Aromatoleum petrolei]